MTAIALRMTGADFLKLRKKRSTLIWALVLALASDRHLLHGQRGRTRVQLEP